MYIQVKVKTKAKKKELIKVDEETYKISVVEAPEKNKANFAIIDLLAEYFGISKSQVKIVSGQSSPIKLINIEI